MIMRMIEARVSQIEARAALAARRAAWGAAGAVFLLIGFAFLLVAAWILLVELTNAQTAALTMGLVLAGIGLVLLGVSASSTMKVRPAVKAPPVLEQPLAQSAAAKADGLPAVAQAFLVGLQAGVSANRRKRH